MRKVGSFEYASGKVSRRIGNALTRRLFGSNVSAGDIEDIKEYALETGNNTDYVAGSPSGTNVGIGQKYKLSGKILGAIDAFIATPAYAAAVAHGMDLYKKIAPGSDAYDKLNFIDRELRDFVSANAPKFGPITPVLAGWIALIAIGLVSLGLYLHGRDKENEEVKNK